MSNSIGAYPAHGTHDIGSYDYEAGAVDPPAEGGSFGIIDRRRLLREKRAKAARLGLKRFRRGRFM